MTMNLSSLGAYPTDSYYDPDRPSWLPYWIDDSAESAAKYNSETLTGQMGGVVGAAVGSVANTASDAIASGVSTAFDQSNLSSLLLIGGLAFLLISLKR